MGFRAINVTSRKKDEKDCGGKFRAARILLAKYFFNRHVPTGTGCTGTNLEWKMWKDQSAMENRSEWEGAEMTLHSKAHFPALAALRAPPNVVLLTQVSRKGSRNKTLLQLCKTTFLKQFFFSENLSDNNSGIQGSKREPKFLLQPPSLCSVFYTDQTRDTAERS